MNDHRQPVAIGGRVPTYSRKAWSRIPSSVKVEDLWQLCGPQVNMHVDTLPLWKVFCVVYYEGLMHGAATAATLDGKGKTT